MPQRRTLLQSTSAFTIEQVQSFAPMAQWSPVYRVATQRFVLPYSGVAEFRFGDSLALLDGISVLCLPVDAPYQMKQIDPMQSHRGDVNASIVISLPVASGLVVAQPRVGGLSAWAQWQLRRHWRALARSPLAQHTPLVLPVRQLLDSAFRALETSPTAASAKRIHSVKRDIARRVASLDTPRWTLHDVADAADLSPFHLARIFKAETGMTLHAYRQQLRLAMALQCLQGGMPHGQVNLAELAAGLGYSSQSHMGFAFQRELGVTPAQARLQLAD